MGVAGHRVERFPENKAVAGRLQDGPWTCDLLLTTRIQHATPVVTFHKTVILSSLLAVMKEAALPS